MFKYSNIETLLPRIIRWGLYAALFTPFVFWRTFMFPFVTPRVFGFHILVEVIFGAWLLLFLLHPHPNVIARRYVVTEVSLAIFILLAVLLITAATGVNFERSFWSTYERGIGIFSLLHFAAFFLVLSDFLRRGIVSLDSYFKVALLAAAGVSAGAVLQVYRPQFFLSGDYRPGSFLGNPAHLASYAIFCVFLCLWLARRFVTRTARWIFTALAAFQAIVIVVFTQTRGAIVGLGVGLFFILGFLSLPKAKIVSWPAGDKIRKLARILLVLAAFLVAIFWFTRNALLWQEVPGISRMVSPVSGDYWDVGPRLLSWQAAWKSFGERPLLGWGFENFKYAMDKNFQPPLFRYGFIETYWDKPHNIFLEYLVAGGALGILAFLALFVAAFRSVWRLPFGVFFAAALAAHLASNIFIFDTFNSYLMFFLVLAAADSVSPAISFKRKTSALGMPDVSGKMDIPGTSEVQGISDAREIPAIRETADVRKTGVMIYHNTALKVAVAVLTAVLVAFLVYLNVSILYANNRHYWGANYFVNDLPGEALASFRKSLNAKFNPYVNATRRDFGDLATQMYVQGKLPEPEKNLPRAVAEVDKAIGEDPNNYYLYLTLADMIANFYELNPGQLLSIGQSAINKAIELSPGRQQNYYVKAKIHLIKNEDKEAVAAMEKAVALDPQIGDPHFYYALTLFEVGDAEKGFAELKIAEKLGRTPNTAEEARAVANYYGDAGDWENSVFWYKIAITKEPSDNEARLKLGLVYYMSGRPELAKEEISKVMQKTDLTRSPIYEILIPILRDLGLKLPDF